MRMIKKLGAAAMVGAASIALSACATGLPANVTRYSALPIPAGQTFQVVPANGMTAGLEFGRFGSIVAQQLQARGYRPAANPQSADMIVRIGYGVDQGTRERSFDPFQRHYSPFYRPYGYGAYYGRPYYSRYGYWGARSPFYYGWDDPHWLGGRSDYVVYKSVLDMNIVRRVDNAPLFEGRAQARSHTDQAGVLVPNLIEAMFTGFPGRNGETVRITVPPAPRR